MHCRTLDRSLRTSLFGRIVALGKEFSRQSRARDTPQGFLPRERISLGKLIYIENNATDNQEIVLARTENSRVPARLVYPTYP